MPSKEYHQILEQLKNLPASNQASIEELREGFEKLLALFPPESDIQFEPLSFGSISACWVLAPNVSRKKIVLFLHGGGFNAGSVNSHRNIMGRISRASGRAVLGLRHNLSQQMRVFPVEPSLFLYFLQSSQY